ncbi:MAG: flagellar motor protein MotA [Deltaproteobacteria bacterium]|nr:MAG: flagellar motor protein MotA [Deltaproteobacteria bacterium]
MMKFVFIPVICSILISAHQTNANTWGKAVAQITQEIKETQKDIETTRKMVQQEQIRLKKELSALRQETEQKEKTLQASKDQLEGYLQTEEKLRSEIEKEEKTIRTLEETLRTVAKDVTQIIDGSLAAPENSSQKKRLAPLLDPDRFPGMTDIENLAAVLFEEMEAGKTIRKYSGTFIDTQGAEASGTILRVGKFTACYQQGDNVGYLRSDKNLDKLVAIPGKSPWRIGRGIKTYFSGENDHLPLDLSGGIIAEQVNQDGDIRGWIEAGGLLVWPILAIALIAILLSLERLYSIGRIPTKTDKIMDRMRDLALEKNWEACKELCHKNARIPTCNVLKTGLEHLGAAREVLENALEEAILKELPRLERFLTTLGVLAAIAPLLGLLGTVTGMIHTFQGITVFGTSDPRMMSGGISEALVTTQLGLAVAIPIMIVHHFFDRRTEKIIGDMEEKGTALMTIVGVRGERREK